MTSSSSCETRRRRPRRSSRASSRSRSRSYELEPGVVVSGKIDRVDGDPMSARGIVVDYKSGAASSAPQIHDERDLLQMPLYMLVLRDQLGLEPMGGVYMPVGGGRRARGMLRAGDERCRASVRGDYLEPDGVRRRRSSTRAARRSASSSGSEAATSATTRRAATARLVRPLADLPQGAPVRPTPNHQQQAAIDARGGVFVSAGAGTGKTTVLVERFARAVVDDGLDVDSLLVITYTDRAAGELRARIRAAPARARAARSGARARRRLDLDDPRLLPAAAGAYPLAAGIDPRFRVLDEPQARVLQGRPSTPRSSAFCAADEPDRWQLLATYGATGLRKMLVERLRHAALGRPRARARAGRCARASTTRVAELLARRRAPRRRREARPTSARRPRGTRSTCSDDATLPERLLELTR